MALENSQWAPFVIFQALSLYFQVVQCNFLIYEEENGHMQVKNFLIPFSVVAGVIH